MRVRIIGTGSFLPGHVRTNADLEGMVDTTDEWIRLRTGIEERRIIADDMATSDMGTEALKRALEMSGRTPDDLDMIICATVTPDYSFPSTAVLIQQKVGHTKNCPAFDLSAACAGSLYAISIASAMIQTGLYKCIAVVATEALSRITNWQDRDTCVLFGDGAGALIVAENEPSPSGIYSVYLASDGTQENLIKLPAGGSAMPASMETIEAQKHFIHMRGRDVYRYAGPKMADACKFILKRHGFPASEVNLVVPHQANLRIIESVSKRVSIPMDRFFINIQKYGNTSAASCLIALDEAVRCGRISSGDLILMVALGSGLTSGSALIRW